MRFIYPLLCVLLLSSTVTVSTPVVPLVAHGEDVADGQYPFAVSLSMPKITRPDGSTYASACSAGLVARRWIISAGHCFHDGARNPVSGPPRYQVVATVGQATLSGTGGQRVEVVDVVQREDVDIALARLASPVRGITPLGITPLPPAAGDLVRLTGWGSRDSEAELGHRPDRLQTGLWEVGALDDSHLYMSGRYPARDTSACPFDSGAPVFRRGLLGNPVLVATEISGPDCPHDQPETTARTDVLAGWIWSHIGA
ncbi:S1 family peptidase [Pseudonocardiaceae bacterium YIM PH 21723]|nr:S1 family peptidase [Pseudonocardiaceae bacterium YIM PH 21723]